MTVKLPHRVVVTCAGTLLLASLAAFLAAAAVAETGRRPLTEEEGLRVAEAARAYAEVTYTMGETSFTGIPYAWGGRVTVEEFLASLEGGGDIEELGVDASGVAVNALRAVDPNVRFLARPGDDPVYWADATSAVLYEFNVAPVASDELRAGDLIFFRSGEGTISGVAVVTGRRGNRVDFVVASARQGRVIHTFARTDGDYWRQHIAGGGRFLLAAPAP
ncbi:MAG: C40 family peptidase [Firmicutes bacterium]|nr:C40 family peptidase [Bacillota bacterium]